MDKKAKKKAVKRRSYLTPEDRAMLIEAFNAGREVAQDVLECGSAMANSCHDADSKIYRVGCKLGFKQETNWMGKFK